MHRILWVLVILVAVARADDRKEEFRLRDEARHAVADGINKNDAKAVAAYVDSQLETAHLWFDTPACRKQFSDAKVNAKDVAALVACLAPLGIDAKTLLVRYGPDVVISLGWRFANGKVTLVSMKGDGLTTGEHPQVWLDAFEQHRKAGTKTIAFDAKARAEIENSGDPGVFFEVCVDEAGKVVSAKPIMGIGGSGPTAKALAAATKDWKFEPFLVRGKPVIACAIETAKL